MRAVLWLVSVLVLAVTLGLVLVSHQATVTLFWPPHRVDVSFNLFVLVLGLLFVLLYGVLRAVQQLWAIPQQAREWRERQREAAMYKALIQAVTYWVNGRFVRSRKAALQTLERAQTWSAPERNQAEVQALAHLLVAESAHALQDRATRDQHQNLALGLSARLATDLHEGLQLRSVRWALDDRRALDALQQLTQLPHGLVRRSFALRLRLKAARLAGQTSVALDAARALVKHGAYAPDIARSLMFSLLDEALRQCQDSTQVEALWQSWPAAERLDGAVAHKMAQRLLDVGGPSTQAALWLWPVWQALFERKAPSGSYKTASESVPWAWVRTLVQSLDTVSDDWLALLENAAEQHPRDWSLRYLAGGACKQRGLWGKAQQWLEPFAQNTAPNEPHPCQAPALILLAHLAEQRGDNAQALKAWKRAAILAHRL